MPNSQRSHIEDPRQHDNHSVKHLKLVREVLQPKSKDLDTNLDRDNAHMEVHMYHSLREEGANYMYLRTGHFCRYCNFFFVLYLISYAAVRTKIKRTNIFQQRNFHTCFMYDMGSVRNQNCTK